VGDSYRPFAAAVEWGGVRADEPRLARYAERLRNHPQDTWPAARDRLRRAAALESSALDDLLPANPDLTSLVLSGSVSGADSGDEDPADVVAECHRRALVLAGEAAEAGRPVDVNLIAVLQDMITESQVSYTVTTETGDTFEVDLPRWQYKPVSNYLRLPGGRLAAFAPVGVVAAEMARLTGELSSPGFAALHPVVQAAYAHYALTAIHPFADGNGRLARTVASVYLIRAYGLPLLVFADQWPGYYQALNAATQAGDWQSLADFFAAATLAALDLATSLLAGPPDPAGGSGSSEPAPSQLEEAARALLDVLAIEVRQLLAVPPAGVSLAVARRRLGAGAGVGSGASAASACPAQGNPGYRPAGDTSLAVRGGRPPADLEFIALVSEAPGDLLPVAISEAGSGERFEAALGDVHPLVLSSTAVRVRLWAGRLLAAFAG
jgi:Fic family protein